MSQSIQVIENRVSKGDADTVAKSRQIGYRAQELADYARAGYDLAHTATIDGPEYVTFVDTLTRTTD
ncbi:hypothetical protein [Herbiconiux sp. L3-i23]|uniref:hypothetical protein n=1 Tax=Herbiconiux sp. L3-i23 TaxID=2905871 RepID=UPI00205EC2AE|nr:hypothetical protein [Herbiconiux sp. L3-i23]BDI24226.1 hypothetical protein L3i23_30020 [Herbiconiux sp. L3-i23]